MKKTIALCLATVFFITGCSLDNLGAGSATKKEVISTEEAKAIAIDFINANLVQSGTEVSIPEIVLEDGLYKLTVSVPSGDSSTEIDSYLTLDGKKFFPQVMNIEEIEQEKTEQEAQQQQAAAATVADIPKEDKVSVELFVMSHCPYGTQIEKGILPVLDTLGDKIDFELKFCTYAMHDKKELDEQLNQYCIQKNEPEKLSDYLYCFLEEGQSAQCVSEVGINKSSLDACVSSTDKQYKVTEKYNDKSTWSGGRFPVFDIYKTDNEKYGITGSPGLVVNGKKVSSARDAKSLLGTVCAGFNSAPEECNTELSSDTPSAGFGFSGTSASSAGGCGS